MSIKETFQDSFETYAGMTIMDRAICDVRDCLKPSTRMSIYAQYIDKITADRPYKKSQKSVASAMDHFYVHGDLSLYPLLARLGKTFAMRYVLEDFQGNTGTIECGDNEAASRYTEMRLAPLSMNFFKNIEKNTITKWYDSYNGEEQYPAVLPSIGFYNIVNGTNGIATGISSSIPQFNLKEVNDAMIKLLWNPDINVEDIICMPDFCTGATILNEEEVRESLKNGQGKACKLRSEVIYDEKERKFIVTEIPYSVYTETIRSQLKAICEDTIGNPGIDRFLDFSGSTPNIEIYLKRGANPDRVLKYLYKNTYLQYHYSINMYMLNKGKIPKIFGWKEALQAHINHEKEVYIRGYNFDLVKIEKRLHIIEGILKALDLIDEVIETIKTSSSYAAASTALQQLLTIDDVQAKAILDIKLARLARLEVNKLTKERAELNLQKETIESILNDENLLKKEIEKGFLEVSKKYGDERRTKIMNLDFSKTEEDEEPIEVKELNVYLTNKGNLYTDESSTLYTQRRGGKGVKFKLDKDEFIITSQTTSNENILLAFSNKGKVYSLNLATFPIKGRVNIGDYFILDSEEYLINIAPCGKKDKYDSVVFITKNGMIKRTKFEEYKIKKSKGVIATKLKDNDELVSTLLVNNEKIGFLTKTGNFLIINIENINPTGRATSGVKGIKLSDDDYVVAARKIKETAKEIITITENGLISRTDISEFGVGNRATKGTKVQKLKDNDYMADFLPINDKKEISIVSTKGLITIELSSIAKTLKGATGNIGKKVSNNEIITNLM